ncbi:MAG: hypothetical protein QS748_03470 [Candidatus Endonucleobacter bathymodioli]|uniref:Uncharacterized protein n=1 Tax=Candidatus Endonucleibacter bathymodioli TaxID=539814 RepID=A0AA90NKF1_9GAMM|nr:hypothetical protein [Candidatus Endonucleobacter bathymodioli]
MLRTHFIQQWYSISDPAEDALYYIPAMRCLLVYH